MNRRNDWKNQLRIVNEYLDKTGYFIDIVEPEEGCYDCEIWFNDKLVDTYAENYYEDELSDLIDDAWSHVNGLVRMKKAINR